jgi:hypothetical protein
LVERLDLRKAPELGNHVVSSLAVSDVDIAAATQPRNHLHVGVAALVPAR